MANLEISLEEVLRISDLHELDILDTPAEQDYDDLVELASMICGCPMSLISLIDNDRQWFKSKKGVDDNQTSRDISFCSHAIKQDEVFVVENTLADDRFKNNPFVTGEIQVRFYAGAPIYSPQGYKMGTLCVIDRRPKTLLPKHIDALKKLSNQASKLLELRLKTRLLDKLLKEQI
jgi:two-component system, sensor histidine kinase